MTRPEIHSLLETAERAELDGNYQDAYSRAHEIIEAMAAADDIPALIHARAVRLWGSKVMRDGDYTEALTQYSLLLEISEKAGSRSGQASAFACIGQVHGDMANYSLALDYYRKALAIDEEIGNRIGAATCLGCIGNVYQGLSDFTTSLEYHSQALAIDEELENRPGVARHLGNIGIIHHTLEDFTKAIECYSKALAIDEELGNKDGMARHLGNMGETYHSLGDVQRTQEYLLKALHLAESVGATWPRLHWLQALGIFYTENNASPEDAAKAEDYLRKAIGDSATHGVKHISRTSSHFLYTLLKEQERWQEALEMKELSDRLNEEINVEEARKQEVIRQQKQDVELARARASAELHATTSLLHRVLPPSIASRIINGEQEIADYFPTVSILFADIAGFTPLAADMPAIVVVRFLNFVFATFDVIIKRHGCEKIKTIGDGYMAVCGAPLECADHAERIALAAIEMQKPIVLPEEIRDHLPLGTKLGVRIGLHTGSIVAGVIGEERFVYDIYSDAVNTAARMESQGEADKIHVSNDFYRHLQNRFAMTKNTSHGIIFEKRGEIEIKGKGMMKTFFLSN